MTLGKRKHLEGSSPKTKTFKQHQRSLDLKKQITCRHCLCLTPRSTEATCQSCGKAYSDEHEQKSDSDSDIILISVVRKKTKDGACEDAFKDAAVHKPIVKAAKKNQKFAMITSISLAGQAASPFCYEGRVAMTPAMNSPHPTIEFKDLVSQHHGQKLEEGIFSAYCLDPDWLGQFLPASTPMIFATTKPRDRDSASLPQMLQLNPFITMIFPPMPNSSFGCMHIKLVILMYENRCRVAIPSANLIQFDWETMENICYYQDFPLAEKRAAVPDLFKKTLSNLLGEMMIPASSIQKLQKYDFSTAIGTLVISKPGQSSRSDTFVYGLHSLSRAVASLELLPQPQQNPSIFCQSSSVGSLNQKWIDEFMSSIAGKSRDEKVAGKMHLLFPTLKTVQASNHGINGGLSQASHLIDLGFLTFSLSHVHMCYFRRNSLLPTEIVGSKNLSSIHNA